MSSTNAGMRTTSAGYRFPETQWGSSPTSFYHVKCTPKIVKERVKSAPPRTYSQREYAKCDVVREDEIWKNQCKNEKKMVLKWWVLRSYLRMNIRLHGSMFICLFRSILLAIKWRCLFMYLGYFTTYFVMYDVLFCLNMDISDLYFINTSTYMYSSLQILKTCACKCIQELEFQDMFR
jgi:hypothetical protein